MELKMLDRSKFIKAMKEQLTIRPETTAIVAVDMHQGHLDPEVAPMVVEEDDRKRVLTNTKRLIRVAGQYGIPVIHVIFQLRPIENERRFNPFGVIARAVHEKLKPEERSWNGKKQKAGWWTPKIMPEVAPGPNDYVIDNKKTLSVYYGTDLENLLRTLRMDTVVVIGINTNTCDLCGSFETVNRGFKLVMISDCVASAYGKDLHEFALQNVARCMGWVLTIPEFEAKLRIGSKTVPQ